MVWRDDDAAGTDRLTPPRAVRLGAAALAAAIAVFLGNSVFAWRSGWAEASDTARAVAAGATLLLAGALALLLVLAVGKRNGPALWVLIATIGVAAATTVYRAVSGQLPTDATGILAVVDATLALTGVGLLLVGRGATAWFREGRI